MVGSTKRTLLYGVAASMWSVWLISFGVAVDAQAKMSVLTHHYDTMRTGWNRHEPILNPQNVANLKLLKSIVLDEQVDAQPLLMSGVTIPGQGRHDVVYVATENNTIYGLDATTGATLLTRNFGTPVPMSALAGSCNNNSAVVGINSTPVIDPQTSTLYVMVFALDNGHPTYRLHALGLATLADTTPPVIVTASATLSNGKAYKFRNNLSGDVAITRQRAALLEANGNIYAGFASFCDINADQSRGWLLGWQAASLSPLAANHLNNRRANSISRFYLTSIWMSGSGIAADPQGSLYFVTGNSDPSGTSYDEVTNLAESVVKASPDLTTVEDFFTPSGSGTGVGDLDQLDEDFGSGGVLLLPGKTGTTTLAAAAGKAGLMYLFNRRHLGRYDSSGQNHVLKTVDIGNCWCAESYFTGADGIGRIVSSGGSGIGSQATGNRLIVWRVQNSPSLTLQKESQSALPGSVQEAGFFTTVSSNGTQNPLIWAVGRPVDRGPANVTLYAFDPTAAAQGNTAPLFSAPRRHLAEHRRQRKHRTGRRQWFRLRRELQAAGDLRAAVRPGDAATRGSAGAGRPAGPAAIAARWSRDLRHGQDHRKRKPDRGNPRRGIGPCRRDRGDPKPSERDIADR